MKNNQICFLTLIGMVLGAGWLLAEPTESGTENSSVEITTAIIPSERGKTLAKADESWQWIDGLTLPLEGKPYAEADTPFARLPSSAKEKVVNGTWRMAHCTAGMSYVFRTTSAKLRVNWSLTSDELDMPHMPATGVSGVDLYEWDDERGWQFVKCGFPKHQQGNEFELSVTKNRLYRLYLPLYNGIAAIRFGIEKGAVLTAAEMPCSHASRKPVVVYGGSVVQGACVSRTGNAWVNVLGRLLNRPTVDMGFNGQGRMIIAEADLLAEIDASAYVFLSLGNMVQNTWREDGEKFLRRLHALRPEVPIVFGGFHYLRESRTNREKTDYAEALAKKLKAEDPAFWANLSIIPTTALCPEDGDGTVDGGHPNDHGAMVMAKAFARALLQ